MGLVKLAVVGGAGYWALNKYRKNHEKSQNAPQQPPQNQQYRDDHHPYQPDYYNHNTVRSADDDMYGPPSEKRQYNAQHDPSLRLPHEKPLQLNFVAPSEKVAAQVHQGQY